MLLLGHRLNMIILSNNLHNILKRKNGERDVYCYSILIISLNPTRSNSNIIESNANESAKPSLPCFTPDKIILYFRDDNPKLANPTIFYP